MVAEYNATVTLAVSPGILLTGDEGVAAGPPRNFGGRNGR